MCSLALAGDDLTTIEVAIGQLASVTALVGEFYHIALAGRVVE
jgi:hypothetical protein